MENLKISFDNTTEEIAKAYKAFQTKFGLKRKLIYSVVYLIVIALAVDLVIKNPTSATGYIAGGLALGILAFNWIKPVIIRNKMIASLNELGTDESYIASFFDDRIEIETEVSENADTETEIVAITSQGVIPVEEGSEAAKEIADNPDMVKDETKIEKSVYRLNETEVSSAEINGMFILYINRSYFHIIPKRCVTEEEAEILRNYLADKAILD